MPRPERPLDPSTGPVARFAAALRTLRTEVGNPPYRDMAQRCHASKASLSDAAGGHRLPTWEVTREYVRACGGDVGEWHRRWQAARTEMGLAEKTPPARRRRLSWVAVVTAVAVAVGVTFAATAASRHRAPAAPQAFTTSEPAPRFSGGRDPVADNADPKRSGCGVPGATIVTLDSVEVNTPAENLLGNLQLRHSPACHASWGKFDPSGRLGYLRGPTTVTIEAHRPATGTLGTPFTVTFDGQAVFGNMLLDDRGCVEVTVRIETPSGGGSATTRCVR
jgi:hypothetical protein